MVDLLGKKVNHKMYGLGTVTDQSDSYIMVEFDSKSSQFMYPGAFEKFLVPEEASVLEAIEAEMAVIAAEKEAKKKAEEKKAELEKARIGELSKRSKAQKCVTSKDYKKAERISGKALTYLVFQGDTYDEECRGQFIWAPKYTKGGGTCHHWDRLMDVRKGDVIFHCSNGYIQAVSMAKGECEDSARPEVGTGDWTQWEKNGRRVNCDYHPLNKPLKHGEFKETIIKYCNVKYAPFDKDGNGNMGYLFELNQELAKIFIKEIAKENPEVIDLEYLRFLMV